MFFSESTVIDRFSTKFSEARETYDTLNRLATGLESFWPERWVVVGGGVRDLFFGDEPNDFDILVDAEQESLERVLGTFETSRTQFGGFKVHGNISIDIWAIESMWTVKEGHVKYKGLDTWPESALFNIDACMVNPTYEFGDAAKFCKAFSERTLSLNSHMYPDKVSAAARAFRLSHKYNLERDPSIQKLIEEAQAGQRMEAR